MNSGAFSLLLTALGVFWWANERVSFCRVGIEASKITRRGKNIRFWHNTMAYNLGSKKDFKFDYEIWNHLVILFFIFLFSRIFLILKNNSIWSFLSLFPFWLFLTAIPITYLALKFWRGHFTGVSGWDWPSETRVSQYLYLIQLFRLLNWWFIINNRNKWREFNGSYEIFLPHEPFNN